MPKHQTTGVLNGEDLRFFYYDIGLDNLQGWPEVYEWDSIVAEFNGIIDIAACTPSKMPKDFVQNSIRFVVSNNKKSDNGSKSAAFFRHLRNAFAHYKIVREGDNFILTDGAKSTTMHGLINAELLKQFCFRFFDIREKIINDFENTNDPNVKTNNCKI